MTKLNENYALLGFSMDDFGMEANLSSQDKFASLVGNPSEILDGFDNNYKMRVLLDVVFDQDKALMTNHDLIEESIFLLYTPENAKSKAIYERYQKKLLSYQYSVPGDSSETRW